jgi:hypothetical protein
MSFLQKGSDCEAAFKKFLCNLYHPQVQHIKRSCVSLPVSSRPHFLPVHLWLRGAAVLQVQLPPIIGSYPVGYHNLRSVCEEAMDECGASEAKTSYRCNLLRETGDMPLVGPSVNRKLNRDLQANYLHLPATGVPRSLPRILPFLTCSPLPLFSKKVLAGMARVQNAEDLMMLSWPDKIALLRRRR